MGLVHPTSDRLHLEEQHLHLTGEPLVRYFNQVKHLIFS